MFSDDDDERRIGAGEWEFAEEEEDAVVDVSTELEDGAIDTEEAEDEFGRDVGGSGGPRWYGLPPGGVGNSCGGGAAPDPGWANGGPPPSGCPPRGPP